MMMERMRLKKSEVTKVPVNSEGDDGALMKSVRLRLGLSQAEMGRRLGTYQAVVSQIERGKARLRKGWAERLRGMA